MAFEVTPMAYEYLLAGFTALDNRGNGSLSISGFTYAQEQVYRIEVTIYLQRYENGTWVNFWNDNTTRFNASTVNIDRYITVPKGYSYRIHGVHRVINNGVHETDICGIV